jgi:CheY-like chemotaxis protein
MSVRNGVILLVEDETITQTLMSAQLRKRHAMPVIQAANGFEAAKLLTHHGEDVALLICDINMPGCDGIEMIDIIAAGGLRPPVIFVTGTKSSKSATASLRARAAGFNVLGVLSKPVNTLQLSELVRKVMPQQAVMA